MMKFSNACLLRIAITSSVVLSVLGHARLVDPEGPKRMINPCSGECAVDGVDPYNVNWFTTGTAPGCKATVRTPLCYDYVNRTIILVNM